MPFTTRAVFLGLSLPLLACAERRAPRAGAAETGQSALATREGYLPVPDGRVWYRITGSGPATPVILLHGGPGYSSFYLKSLDSLGLDRPTIRYDQLGSGKADRTMDTLLFTIPHFVAELDSVRRALGARRVHLLGHSWGTILAVEYYRAHPGNVASLVLASPALDIPAWERHARELVRTLPDSEQRAIRVREAQGKFDAPDYQAALSDFYGRYVWRHPVQVDLDSTLATVNEGIYDYMQGPSEFTITGTLKRYDATAFLTRIGVPTLYTVGEYDEANPMTVRRFADLTPHAEIAVIPGAAHITTWDAPAEMLAVVRGFLRRADSLPRSM
ncbi:MAG TPA: proline iminopeptidase-family hydrolase [Gemmatimonadales bacterium]|nr:proline iminopeptidase-family hydrolase [Gemmatimonadales bacterium]